MAYDLLKGTTDGRDFSIGVDEAPRARLPGPLEAPLPWALAVGGGLFALSQFPKVEKTAAPVVGGAAAGIAGLLWLNSRRRA